MKPPADRHLDLSGAGTDLPLVVRPRYMRWSLLLGIATVLGLVSAGLAWQLTATLGQSKQAFFSLMLIDCAYWYGMAVAINYALRYYRESRDRAVRASQLEARLADAQLKTLQQQLHPHFLFNTLHAISALMHKDVEAADRTLMRLSDLLRLTLERLGQQAVPLAAELDFLRKYVEIERTRFADRLIVRYDVQPEAYDVLVPTLLLQPLVENAIKHGVARRSGPGHIDINARREHDKLVMEVRDDGVGLSEDAFTALQKGFGVSTTHARLKHQFGADYRFEFHRLSQGLAVVVAVPWRTDGTQNARGEQHEEAANSHRGRRAARKRTPGEPAFGRTGY
jgi:signal transduction histidine kinase